MFLKKQREKEDFEEEFEVLKSKSSLDESIIEDLCLNKPSFDKNNIEVNKKEDNTCKRLGDWDKGV